MTPERAIEVITERIIQGVDKEFQGALNHGIVALGKTIAKKPYMDNENGVYETEFCPTCDRKLFPNEHHCRCGQLLDWEDVE